MKNGFSGFPKDLFNFLTDLSKNNNREWFAENKDRYRKSVVNPVCDFVEAIAPRLDKISNCFIADSRSHNGSMFRIYRDTRFSKDKRPYKENVGCHFKHESGKDAHAPGFYLHMEPGKVFYGGGIWQPPNTALDLIRRRIVDQPSMWRKIITNKKIKADLHGIQGDGLKRPPRGFDADHPFIEDLKRKSYYIMKETNADAALSADFIKQVDSTFKTIGPLMQFLTDALQLPYERT